MFNVQKHKTLSQVCSGYTPPRSELCLYLHTLVMSKSLSWWTPHAHTQTHTHRHTHLWLPTVDKWRPVSVSSTGSAHPNTAITRVGWFHFASAWTLEEILYCQNEIDSSCHNNWPVGDFTDVWVCGGLQCKSSVLQTTEVGSNGVQILCYCT